MKILHTADWHLDAPLQGYPETLRQALSGVPAQILELVQRENCDLVLISGDIFDGAYTRHTYQNLYQILEQMTVPVFITPGNHDFTGLQSPWLSESWPENVHIFTRPVIETVDLPALGCRVYGAGFAGMDCTALLRDFRAEGENRMHIGVFHGDPTVVTSPYNPITRQQVQHSGLQYLALGHIHKQGAFTAGETLCAWPGCPMGRGYDELGAKGVLIATLDEEVKAYFVPLDTPRFYDEEVKAGDDPVAAVASLLPGIDSSDFYRIPLTGYSTGVNLEEISAQFPHIPNLTLRDETRPEMDLWSDLGSDTLEGVYFGLLHDKTQSESAVLNNRAKLAARISRQILDGQEVKLP
jgi:DNA repair exonuclease SbcCD nuclease subunit